MAGTAVDGHHVAFVQHGAADGRLALVDVDIDVFRADHAGLAHAARHHRRVRGLAAAAGEDADRREEAVNVFRLGFLAHQDDLLVVAAPALDRRIGVEHDLSGGRAGGGAHALRGRSRLVFRVELREHHLFQRLGIDAQQRLIAADQAFLRHFHRAADHGGGVHLAVAGLQAVEHALFDGVLVILDLVVVAFQLVPQFDQLPEQLRHFFLHLQYRLRRADAGHHVLALGVDQIFAIHHVFAGAGVAGEADAGRAVVAHVAEHHGHHVDRRAVGHFRGDLELAAVIDRPLAHPGVEHRLDRQFQLFVGVLRERPAGLFLDHFQEQLSDILQVVGVQAQVDLDAGAALDRFKVLVEVLVVDAQRDFAEQLDKAAVGVVTEAFVAGQLDQARQGGFVQAQVQDGVHHARHGHGGAGAHRHQQGIGRAAELLAGFLLQPGHVLAHALHQSFGQAVVGDVIQTGLGSDDETRRHSQPDLGHFTQVGALAAQQHFVLAIPFGVLINVLFRHDPTFIVSVVE